jgi:hypothetical protein
MVQQMMLKFIISENTNQNVLVTGSKQNKWGLGKMKKKKKFHSPNQVSNPRPSGLQHNALTTMLPHAPYIMP